MLLYLVRHGETEWNADRRFQGQRDTPLSEKGRMQAGIVARALAERQFSALYSSDLSRAAETAEIIADPHGLSPLHDIRLRELSFGEWEGLSLLEVTERWPEMAAAWRADSLRTRPPGGETPEGIRQRVAVFIDEIIMRHPDDHSVCIVGHGGSLRALVAHVLSADLSIYRALHLDNCSISIIRISEGKPSLLLLNDVCHLTRQDSAAPRTV